MSDTVIKIQAYNEFAAGMAALKDEGNFIPCVDTKEGYEASKEYAKKARKVEINIEKTRVAEKKYFVEGGRQVDLQAKTLLSEISASRLPHFEAVKAVDDAEKLKKQKRQDEATAKIDALASMIETAEYLDSVGVSELIEQCEQFDTEKGLWELTGDGVACKARVGKKLLEMYLSKQQSEANEKELAELRAKQAIQDQKDHDAEVARKAKEAAEAETKLAQEREEQAKRDKLKAEQDTIEAEARFIEQEKQAKIDTENAKAEAQKQSEQAAENARIAEVARQKAEQEAAAAEQAKLEANKKHVGKIRGEIKDDLIELGLSLEDAKKVTLALGKTIRNTKINY